MSRIEAQGQQLPLEEPPVVPKPSHQLVALLQHLHRGQVGRHVGDGQRAAEEIGPGLLAQIVHQLGLPRRDAPHDAEGLGKGPHLHVHPAVKAEMIHDAPSAPPQNPFAVGVVHHQDDSEGLTEIQDLRQPGDVPVHGEDPVGDQELAPRRILRLLQLIPQIRHVRVGVPHHLRLGKLAGVDDGGVVQGIAVDQILRRRSQRGNHRQVGAEARLHQDRRLRSLEGGELALQLDVGAHRPGDRPYRPGAHAVPVHVLLHLADQAGMVAQPQVVVGAEIQDLPALDRHPGPLGALQGPDSPVEPSSPHGIQLVRQKAHRSGQRDLLLGMRLPELPSVWLNGVIPVNGV